MLFIFKISPIIFIKKYNCIKCHKMNKNLEIPSFKKISYKYTYNKFFKKYLFKKIKLGSSGVWSNLIMPKNKIKNSFIKFIVNWILNIKNN